MTERAIFCGACTAVMRVTKRNDDTYVGFAWMYPRGGLRGPDGPPKVGTAHFTTEVDAWHAIENIVSRFLCVEALQ
jgi:hypothetical protein